MVELDQMKDTMDRMEQERAEMVAEVEAQIERALASMAVDFDSDYSRPGSRQSSAVGSVSRRPSDASGGVKHRQLRSFGTESTLAESYDDEDTGAQVTSHDVTSKIREATTIKEDDEEEPEQPLTPSKKKRFSASDLEGQQDGMNAVDEGISLRSDKIAQKVFEIQQKVSRRGPKLGLFMNMLSLFTQLESALQTEPRAAAKWKTESEEDSSESAPPPVAARPNSSRSRVRNSMKKRSRSGTASSTQTHTQTDDTAKPTKNRSKVAPEENKTPTRGSFSDADRDDMSTPEPVTQSSSSDASTGVNKSHIPSHKPPALSARSATTTTGTTDDSDTDFQSAYSASPRGSYGSFENTKKQPSVAEDDDEPQPIDIDEDNLREDLGKNAALSRSYRGRVSSVVSVLNARDRGNVSLPLSDNTVTAST